MDVEQPLQEEIPQEHQPQHVQQEEQARQVVADQLSEEPVFQDSPQLKGAGDQEPQQPEAKQDQSDLDGSPEPAAEQEQEQLPPQPQSQQQEHEAPQQELSPEAQALSLITDSERQKARLYSLSDDSAWEDTGTGYPCVIGTPAKRRLMFLQEGSGILLHDRPVFARDTYQLQGEGERRTIIVWEDAETRADWALSFCDPDYTIEMWELLRGDDENRILPLPTFANLAELGKRLTYVMPSLRETLALECLSPKFIRALQDVFHTVEDVESEVGLASLWQIAKGIFLLSNDKVTERYLRQDVCDDILGMLEHDAGLPANKRTAHRAVLKGQVHFKQVLSFDDVKTVERIHLNYRLQYLKDIVLARLLDDMAFGVLTQMIHRNLAIILDHLHHSPALLEQLFCQIRQKDRQSLQFLQDVCRLAKQIAPTERQELHNKMAVHGFFSCLVPFLTGDIQTDEKQRGLCHVCVEILLISTHNDPANLRRFLTVDGGDVGSTLLRALVNIVHFSDDLGVQSQVSEVLRAVMDLTLLDGRDKDTVLDAFYEGGVLDELITPLRTEDSAKQRLSPGALFGQQLACELVAFAVSQHGYRARVFIIRNGVIQHAARLLASPHKFLQLAPVRLLDAAVRSKDDAYHRYLMKCCVFDPMLRALEQSLRPPSLGSNLLVSSILQVFEVMRIENIKVLIEYACTKHEDTLRQYGQKVHSLQLLLLKHQQNKEYEAFPPERHAAGGPISSGSIGASGRSGRMRSPGRGDDSDDDESYFESLDDDDEPTPQPTEVPGVRGDSVPTPALASTAPASSTREASRSSLQGLLGSYAEEDERDIGRSEGIETSAAGEGSGMPSEPECSRLVEPSSVATGSTESHQGTPEVHAGGHVGQAVARKRSESPDREPESADGTASANVVTEHEPKRLKTAAAAADSGGSCASS